MLSRGECEVLFGQNITDSETVENIDDLKSNDSLLLDNYRGTISVPRDNTMKINSNGMKFIKASNISI